MPPETTTESFEDQAKGLITESYQDGSPSDGGMTADEQAAVAAETARANGEAPPKAGEEQPASEVDEEGEAQAAEGEEAAQGAAEEPKEGEQPKEEPKPKTGKKSVSERIGDLTARARTSERRVEQLQAELEALKSGKTPLTASQSDDKGEVVAPDPADFDYGELDPKYIAALARHETAQALKQSRAEEAQSRQAEAADAKRQEQATKVDSLVQAGVKLHADFDEVVMQGARDGVWDLSKDLFELIVDSEYGPHIAYELAKDPAEAERVFKLTPAQQAAFFGRQEAKFEAAKPSQRKAPPVSQVPPPPKTPKSGSGSTKVDPSSENFADVEAAWNSGGFR